MQGMEKMERVAWVVHVLRMNTKDAEALRVKISEVVDSAAV